ncbi:MAG: transglycosylase SLT domain-containing protein [Longimicrobiales bacterium]
MKHLMPAVRAACERVRRPNNIQILLGIALMTPAALITHGISGQTAVNTIPEHPPVLVGVPVETPAPPPSAPAIAVANPAANASEAEPSETPSPAHYARDYQISEPLAKQIQVAAVANGISPRTAFGLVRAESSFRSRAISPVGAVGLTQIMPATARWLKPGTTRRELMDPSFNLHLGFSYLRQLIDDYNGNERLALTAFNRGPGTVNKLLRRGRNPDNGYADKVLTGKSTKHVQLMNAKFGRKRT